jgi:hypothetical protein
MCIEVTRNLLGCDDVESGTEEPSNQTKWRHIPSDSKLPVRPFEDFESDRILDRYMKRFILWHKKPCIPVNMNQEASLAACLLVPYLVYSSTLKMRQYVPPNRRFTFTGLHDAAFQKIKTFTITPVRTSNPNLDIWYESLNNG